MRHISLTLSLVVLSLSFSLSFKMSRGHAAGHSSSESASSSSESSESAASDAADSERLIESEGRSSLFAQSAAEALDRDFPSHDISFLLLDAHTGACWPRAGIILTRPFLWDRC
jgi:hypothetical protein